jgi:uncharacterized protein with ParB-like and HNH nuclease domain
MSKGVLETSTTTWGELVGNGRRLEVPPFQRNYAWEERDWEDLWSDLMDVETRDVNHYMGSVVLQPRNERLFLLIDGQQRLTTLSILATAAINQLQALAETGTDTGKNRRRAELLKSQLLGSENPASLRHEWKLKLNRQCDPFYQSKILTNQIPAKTKDLSQPQKLMCEAYDFFRKKFATPEFADGERLATFLSDVVSLRLLFIQVKVEDEVSAYTVFETLNARGTELTPTDLLKNYLFSLVSDEASIDYLDYHWELIGARIGWKQFSTFLRHYLNSLGPLIREKALFREMKNKYSRSDQVKPLLDLLSRESVTYQSLQDPSSSDWVEWDTEIRQGLKLLKGVGIEQALPALLAGFRRLNKKVFVKLVRALGVALFRFAAVGHRANNIIEVTVSKLALGLEQETIKTLAEIERQLLPIYPNDDKFREDFATWAPQASKKELIRLVLSELQGVAGSEDNLLLNLEHLLPKNNRELRQWTSRLGNLFLVDSELNRRAGDLPFLKKCSILKDCKYFPQRLLEFSEWGPTQIESNQRGLAEDAVKIWRFTEV